MISSKWSNVTKKGEREFRDIPVKHTFYVKDPRGKYQSIYGDQLTKIVCKNTKELRKEQAINSGKKCLKAISIQSL